MYRVLARLAVLSAALIMATPCLADPQPNPHVDVSAIHLGGGQIQYTILLNNPSGGSAGANVTAVGNFNQIDTTANFLRLLEPGPVDTFFEANLATAFDPLVYGAANGLVNDSYWDDSGLSIAIGVDGVTGGEVGSMVFSFEAVSPFGSDISNTRLAQLVVFDLAAAVLPLGPQPVVSTGQFARFSFVDDSAVFDGMGRDSSIVETFSVGPPRPPLPPLPLSVDPDAFPAGTDITNAFPGVTLSSVGPGFDGDFDPSIFAINPSIHESSPFNASTGSLVFGTNDARFPHVFSGFGDATFRVDFALPASEVRLDAIGNHGSDFARLVAFDAADVVIDTYNTGQLTISSFETMIVTSASFNIDHVVASGAFGESVGFDRLDFNNSLPEVDLDIKPGSDPNSINLGSRGVLPVAILTTDEFDALQVDLATIVFGDPVLLNDGGIGIAPLRSGQEDVNGDGLIDLTLKFSMRDLVDNGALGAMSMEAILRGLTTGGMMFEASDSVRLVPPGDANNDQIVDAADYTIWADNFNTKGAKLSDGDFNEDHHVDAADYTMWANNVGTDLSAPGSAVAAVPEPGTFALGALGVLCFALGAMRRVAGAKA